MFDTSTCFTCGVTSITVCAVLTRRTRSGPAPIKLSGLSSTNDSLYTPGWTRIRPQGGASSTASVTVE